MKRSSSTETSALRAAVRDPFNATARSKGAVRPENNHIDWNDRFKVPVLFEQQAHGVTVDIGLSTAGFIARHKVVSQVYRVDRLHGTKTLVATL